MQYQNFSNVATREKSTSFHRPPSSRPATQACCKSAEAEGLSVTGQGRSSRQPPSFCHLAWPKHLFAGLHGAGASVSLLRAGNNTTNQSLESRSPRRAHQLLKEGECDGPRNHKLHQCTSVCAPVCATSGSIDSEYGAVSPHVVRAARANSENSRAATAGPGSRLSRPKLELRCFQFGAA